MRALRNGIVALGTIGCWSVAAVTQAPVAPPPSAGAMQAYDDRTPPAGQQTYYFLVFSDPAPGTEAEYNRFYDREHGPDVTAIPGFVGAQRYVMAARQLRAVPLKKPRYLIVYQVVTDDPIAVRAEIGRRARSGQTRQSPTLTNVQMFTYRKFRPSRTGAGGEPAGAKPGTPATYEQIVFGDATPGNDAAFNTWYDTVHEPALLANPGFVEADRAIASEVQLAPMAGTSRYLAMFRIVTADLDATLRGIKAGEEPPPAFDRTRTFGYTYRAIGPAISGDVERAKRMSAKH